jgi:hypothetical protein
VEFYYGSGYLSQSTRKSKIPASVKEMIVYDYSGNRRVIDYNKIVLVNKRHRTTISQKKP